VFSKPMKQGRIHYRYIDTVYAKTMVVAQTPMTHAFPFTDGCPIARIYEKDIKDCIDSKTPRKCSSSVKEERGYYIDVGVDATLSSHESYRVLLFWIKRITKEKEMKADLTKTKSALEKDKTKSESEKANLMGEKKCRIEAWCCEGRKAGQGKGSRGEAAQEVTVEVPGAQGCH
jgi:hypothetical protein